MVNNEIRKKIELYAKDNDQEIQLFDNPSFDNSIVGISLDGRVIYDYNKMIDELACDDDIDLVEAEEFIQYNTIRAVPYFGENSPIILVVSPQELNEQY